MLKRGALEIIHFTAADHFQQTVSVKDADNIVAGSVFAFFLAQLSDLDHDLAVREAFRRLRRQLRFLDGRRFDRHDLLHFIDIHCIIFDNRYFVV